MKLLLTMVARDEEDILRENLLYHLNQGVDFLIVTDNGSKDGTKDIIHEFVRLGVARYLHQGEYSHSQSIWMTQMSEIARTEHNADFVINSDADEFWWPQEGNLKSVLEDFNEDVDAILVKRNNFAPVESDQNLGIFERMVGRDPSGLNGIGRPLPPKVIHRPMPGVIVSAGNHNARYQDGPVRKVRSNKLVIFHFPIRTYPQFSTKIEQGGLALKTFHQESISPTRVWCILHDRLEQGTLHEYYAERMNVETVPDYRLRDFMRLHKII